MRLASRAARAAVVVGIMVFVATIPLWGARQSSAYSWSSFQYYLKNNNGQSHYAYRTLQFQWCCWYNNNIRAAISSISFSARIPSVGWAYYGWYMETEPFALIGWIDRSSGTYEPDFAMDSNNGWVSRQQTAWGDTAALDDLPATLRATTCENSNDCGSLFQSNQKGARVVGAFFKGATSGVYWESRY